MNRRAFLQTIAAAVAGGAMLRARAAAPPPEATFALREFHGIVNVSWKLLQDAPRDGGLFVSRALYQLNRDVARHSPRKRRASDRKRRARDRRRAARSSSRRTRGI